MKISLKKEKEKNNKEANKNKEKKKFAGQVAGEFVPGGRVSVPEGREGRYGESPTLVMSGVLNRPGGEFVYDLSHFIASRSCSVGRVM